MGYTTDFDGSVKFDRVLTVTELRDLEELADYLTQDDAYSKYNKEHPDSYNQWEPLKDGTGLCWNGGEKFYNYTEWLQWLIDNYLLPRNIHASGIIRYQGEEIGDVGRLEVEGDKVTVVELDATGVVECPSCGHKFKQEN